MAKVFVRQSTAVFGVIVFLLLMLCVGLLVVVLKGKMYDNQFQSSKLDGSQLSSVAPKPTTKDTLHYVKPFKPTLSPPLTITKVPKITEPWENFRLPQYIIPLHYDLLLYPDLKNDVFTGHVDIVVNASRETPFFVVHAYKLTVNSAKVFSVLSNAEVQLEKSFQYEPNEFYVMTLKEKAPSGLYRLQLSFKGSLVGSIVGFYKSTYYSSLDKRNRFLATSKFQPTYARRAFPCFDEPSFKSTFNVSLVHEPEYIALSNMPVESIEKYMEDVTKDLRVTKFQKSVPMVTYLACFIVSEFQWTESKTSKDKPFRVYSTPDQVGNTKYALKIGTDVLNYFEDYFGIEYPLPKQDMVAIPDFASGAMEHWGIITYRESNLVYNNQSSSLSNKQRVTTVISHELAHMWFGNLVTMEWWDDLWLNEGFASYVEYKGVDKVFPEWDMLHQFLNKDLQPVMELDSTMSSHPIVQPVSHPDEISEIFDDISYNKGASVLRMLEFFMGPEDFRKGISNFLTRHIYGNARTKDLWNELSEIYGNKSGKSISSVMDTWTNQMGFPYISVIRDKSDPTVFMVKQHRFFKDPEMRKKLPLSSKNNVWSVPLSYKTKNEEYPIEWLHDTSYKTLKIAIQEDDWVKFNINQTGYYLVKYENEDWKRLTLLLRRNHTKLTPADRSNLLHDVFLLAKSGQVMYNVSFEMAVYLSNEDHLVPWETAYTSMLYISRLLESTEIQMSMKSFIRRLTNPIYEKLGWKEQKDHLKGLLQTTIIGLACYSGNENCLRETSERLERWMKGEEIQPSFRNLVYHFGMAEIGKERHWNYMWKRYLREQSAQERMKLLYGLAHVRSPALIYRYLGFAMNESVVRRQDFFTVINYLAGNPVGRPLVWSFLREKWPLLVDRFSLNDRYLGRSVKRICDYFTTEFQLQEMQDFFRKYPEAGAGKRAREQTLENVRNNVKWLKSYKTVIQQWLEARGHMPWLDSRLPTNDIPVEYELTVSPRPEKGNFDGHVTIYINVTRPTDVLVLHASQLTITKTLVTKTEESATIPYETVFGYKPNDYWIIQFKEKLIGESEYKLYMEFEGVMKGVSGLYNSSYVNQETGLKSYLAATMFAPIDARRMFPCFDEPHLKTPFSINVLHSNKTTALSNGIEVAQIERPDGLRETRFAKTVPMVTYLVAVVVSDYTYLEKMIDNRFRFRVYAAPDRINKASFAFDIGQKLIIGLEKKFAINYPMRKLDLIGIPDFAFGAMENYGLITFKETRLLLDEGEYSEADKFNVASIIAHELIHMWFGNLVTMKWWDEIWLNEAFASYFEPVALEPIEETWDMMDQQLVTDVYRAMDRDASVTSRSIVEAAENPEEIELMFDTITYLKGASVLRMLHFVMGEDFITGLKNYLKKYSYENTITQDIFEELTSASSKNLNISLIMDTWTRQMGFPVVTVRRNKMDATKFTVHQHRFLKNPESGLDTKKKSPYNYIWCIPLTYHSQDNPEVQSHILNTSSAEIMKIPSKGWVKFNVNSMGFYLVNYGLEEWTSFAEMLKDDHTFLSPSDRTGLVRDAFLLAKAGYVEYSVALNMTEYLPQERHLVPWKTAYRTLVEISRLLQIDHVEVYEYLAEYIQTITKDLIAKLTWDNTGDHLTKRLRSTLIKLSCSHGNRECLETCGQQLVKLMAGEWVSPELRSTIYKYGAAHIDTEELWNKLWDRYTNVSSMEQDDVLRGLASVKNTTLLNRLIEYAKDEAKIKRNDFYTVLRYIAENPAGNRVVWKFVRTEWKYLVDRFSAGSSSMGRLLNTLSDYFSTEASLQEMKDFFKEYPASGHRGIEKDRVLDTVTTNVFWATKFKSDVHTWLKMKVNVPWQSLRLPEFIIPVHYDLTVHPNITEEVFTGHVRILTNITKSTNYLVVHIYNLDVKKTVVKRASDGFTVKQHSAFEYKRNEFWVVRFDQNLWTGMYELYFEFTGSLKDSGSLVGLYKSSYTDITTKEKRYLLATQFQSTFARRVFPCFDEPRFKSTFTITLVHDNYHSALSNMPVESRNTREDGLVETKFRQSVSMVTYLVCLVISDFKYTETTFRGGKKLRIYAAPHRIEETKHALDVGKRILLYFEEYFGIDYPLLKLDMIALPDFQAGAMENWGLITYRESVLLYDERKSSLSSKLSITGTIAHELAHMWFGNLVTMQWWDDLWLNEGFATYMQYKGISHVEPRWEMFKLDRARRVLGADAKISSHPIVQPVKNPYEVMEIFDVISYSKGSAVLGMLEFMLQGDFQKGISNYLKKYMWKTSVTEDLWNELSSVSTKKLNVTDIMNTWTGQKGFPYVQIYRAESGRTGFTARQHRYTVDQDEEELAGDVSPYNFTWKIPLSYYDTESSTVEITWINSKENVSVPGDKSSSWTKFNVNSTGFYLVNYDRTSWDRMTEALVNNNENLNEADRSNVLNDAFHLAKGGILDYEVPLKLSGFLKKEKNLTSWQIGYGWLAFLSQRVDDLNETKTLLKKYIAFLTEDIYKEFSWSEKSTDLLHDQLRDIIFSLACKNDNPSCLDEAVNLFKMWMQGEEILPSLRSLVYRYGMQRIGNEAVWNHTWQEFLKEDSAQNRKNLMYGLAFINDTALIERYLDYAMNETYVRSQDFFTLLSYIAANPVGKPIVWDFIRKQWDVLVRRFTLQNTRLGGIILLVCSSFSNVEQRQELLDFFQENPEAGAGKRARQQTLESINNNIKWLARHEQGVTNWLQKNVQS